MLKMNTSDGKWVIKDGDRTIIFDDAHDAWMLVFILREIRPKAPVVQKSLYPVRNLNPIPERRIKKIVYELHT